MEKIMTPFGDIDIQIDGQSVDYEAKEGRKLSQWCPNVIGRYQIRITFVPDGFFNHTICCSFNPSCKFKSEIESGELFESMGFYNNQRYKMSIGVEGEVPSEGDLEYDDGYFDYNCEYLLNGMAYVVLPETATGE